MTIKLDLWEKCYLVALFGDVPDPVRLFSVSKFPPQAGAAVMAEGFAFIKRQQRITADENDNPTDNVRYPVFPRRDGGRPADGA